MLKLRVVLYGAVLALLGGSANAQYKHWGDWQEYFYDNQLRVEFRMNIGDDEIRVQWRCNNFTSRTRSCSIGDKKYICTRGSTGNVVGQTGALGERASLPASKEYTFPSEAACRGLGADGMKWPVSRVVNQDGM